MNKRPSLIDAIATGVVQVTAAGEIEWLNAAAEHLLGVSLKRARGQRVCDLAPGLQDLETMLERARSTGQSFGRELGIPAPQRDGSELAVTVRVSPLADSAAGGLIVEFSDFTQRNTIDRENTLISQHGVSRKMIRQLAHEIRNPLGGLRGAAQLLERELPREELKEFTRVIIGEADRLAALMDSLLGPARRPQMAEANVHEILEHVATLLQNETSPQQQIFRDYDPSLPLLWMDRNQITQALLNLGRNAIQATAGEGKLILRTRVHTNFMVNQVSHRLVVSIEFEDDGSGVPQEIRETLFYPLVSGREDGTGLGLPLAQELVSRHQGLIEFTSEPGRTVFLLRLPVLDPAEAGVSPHEVAGT